MYGSGRIGEIISFLETKYSKPVKEIEVEIKLAALCDSLQITFSEFDELISENSPVLRTVKGHCFESYFDKLMAINGVVVEEVGGDNAVDRIVNGKKLQLKTPTIAGTRGEVVQFKTHKTHGAKSEKESMDYYHTLKEFADYLIGLVSYKPLRVLMLKKSELPLVDSSRNHIKSPFEVNWNTHPSLNAFSRIGLKNIKHTELYVPPKKLRLPKTASLIGVDDEIIANSILNESNFRIWDMAVRGFAREAVFLKYSANAGLRFESSVGKRLHRSDKADHAIEISGSYKFVQMKGVSTNNCNFNISDPIIATETQLTRGRVNDHPTQSRLYLRSDFDYLILALDPPITYLCHSSVKVAPELVWEFYLVPTKSLESHHLMQHRLKSLQSFRYSDLQKYKIIDWTSIQL
jgi:hypothetical protein